MGSPWAARGSGPAIVSRLYHGVVNGTFSVIIPTLQRSTLLEPLVAMYSAHPMVAEVLIINNAQKPLAFDDPKVRVFDQSQNLFVNPSWNLGVREARADRLIISNDDILFPPHVIDSVAARLGPHVGIVGPHTSCFGPRTRSRIWYTPTYERTTAYGTLMFMARADYTPIPERMKVWCGDDYLFYRQRGRNLALRGVTISSEMSVTAGAAEFRHQLHEDWAHYLADFTSERPYSRRYAREAQMVVRAIILRQWLRRSASLARAWIRPCLGGLRRIIGRSF